jgi:hypothetical protein
VCEDEFDPSRLNMAGQNGNTWIASGHQYPVCKIIFLPKDLNSGFPLACWFIGNHRVRSGKVPRDRGRGRGHQPILHPAQLNTLALLHGGGSGQKDGLLRPQIRGGRSAGKGKHLFNGRFERPREAQGDSGIRDVGTSFHSINSLPAHAHGCRQVDSGKAALPPKHSQVGLNLGHLLFRHSSRNTAIGYCLATVTLIFLQDMRPHQALSALATIAALSPYCFGQAGKAELSGTIQDPQGLAVTIAKVTSHEQATGARFEVTTDGRGEYHLLGLAAGQYVLTVEKPGFRPYRSGPIWNSAQKSST